MKIKDARNAARCWLAENAIELQGFAGAYLSGSTVWRDPDADFALGSDIDLFVVIDGAAPPDRPGKTLWRGVILDINYISLASIADPARILGDYHLAGAFVRDGLLSDPVGALAEIRHTVARDFARRDCILQRCANAGRRAIGFVEDFHRHTALHDRMTDLFFGAGVCAHMILVADQANPTIRRRYVEMRRSLERFGRLDVHQRLLGTLGSRNWTRSEADRFLKGTARAFDQAISVIRSPHPFASDTTAEARPVAVDGAAEMIDAGFHREAAFWLVAVTARSRAVVAVDGSAAQLGLLDEHVRSLLSGLGIDDDAAMIQRARQVETDVADTWAVCLEIAAD